MGKSPGGKSELSGAGPLPGDAADPDPEWAEYVAWLDREIAAGRDDEPPVWESDALEPPDPAFPGPAFPEPESAGPAAADPVSAGPPRPLFAGGGAADVLPPTSLLAGLTDLAVTDVGRMSDDELVGVLHATRRQVAREQYKQVLVTAEFARRRQDAFADAARRGVPVGCRPGGFPGEELAVELGVTRAEAGHRIDDAADLASRLPRTLAGMAAGAVDEDRAGWIAFYTRSLTPADAAYADEVLAEAAPGLRVDQLARKAARLEMKLNPQAVAARREAARRDAQRVEARREQSGNASLSGRELGTGEVMAAKAHIDAVAARLRESGLLDGNLDQLRALAFTDLTQGRNPLDRIKPEPSAGREPAPPASAPVAGLPNGAPGYAADVIAEQGIKGIVHRFEIWHLDHDRGPPVVHDMAPGQRRPPGQRDGDI